MDFEDIQTIAEKTYRENIAYLQKEQATLFAKIAAFDSALSQGVYQEKYELIHEHGYFEVKETLTNKLLYNADSSLYAKKVSQSVNFSKEDNLFKTFKEITKDADTLKKYSAADIKLNPLSGIASILNAINQADLYTNEMKEIHKFVFFGTGLGEHLFLIHQKINSKVYLIIEDDLELFKLSLFVTPYSQIAKDAKLFFSIFESSDEFSNTASHFIQTHFEFNHYLKYFQMLNHSEEKLKELHIKLISQSHNLFFYNNILEQYLRPLSYIKEEYKFLNILKKYSNQTLGEKPVLYLAAGPSFLKNIAWIKENQNKFVIVAISAVLFELYKADVKPDIVTHLDGFDVSASLFTNIDNPDYFRDIVFLLSARTPQKIINLLNKENIFFFENGTNYKESFGNLSAPCIGSTTFLLLLAFDVKELYLLGLDLSVDSKTGYTHAKSHVDSKQIDLNNVDKEEDNLSFRESLISYPSNFNEIAYTNPSFLISINSINSTAKGFKHSWQNIYNLSDGVRFENTQALKSSEVSVKNMKTLDKEIIKSELFSDLDANSAKALLAEEKELLQQRFNYLLRVKKVIKKQNSVNFTSNLLFLNSLQSLFNALSTDSSSRAKDLSLIYQEYFHLLYTFIFDFFNNKAEIDVSYANTINKLLCKELLKIEKEYEEELKIFI